MHFTDTRFMLYPFGPTKIYKTDNRFRSTDSYTTFARSTFLIFLFLPNDGSFPIRTRTVHNNVFFLSVRLLLLLLINESDKGRVILH